MNRKVNYNQSSYWEERYKASICQWYEWLALPTQLNFIFKQNIDENSKILELGCGTSNLAEKLGTLGHRITAIDFSKQVIKNRSKNNNNQNISYKCHNIQQKFPFQDQQFDIIIEKNTIDCLFCQQNFLPHIFKCMKECYRVLKNHGKMISITHGKQKNRKFFYRNRFSPFQIKVEPLGNKKNNQSQVIIFILTKLSEDQQNQQQSNLNNIEQNNEVQDNLQKQVYDNQNQQKSQNNLNNQQNGQQQQEQVKQQQQNQNQYQFDQSQ